MIGSVCNLPRPIIPMIYARSDHRFAGGEARSFRRCHSFLESPSLMQVHRGLFQCSIQPWIIRKLICKLPIFRLPLPHVSCKPKELFLLPLSFTVLIRTIQACILRYRRLGSPCPRKVVRMKASQKWGIDAHTIITKEVRAL